MIASPIPPEWEVDDEGRVFHRGLWILQLEAHEAGPGRTAEIEVIASGLSITVGLDLAVAAEEDDALLGEIHRARSTSTVHSKRAVALADWSAVNAAHETQGALQ